MKKIFLGLCPGIKRSSGVFSQNSFLITHKNTLSLQRALAFSALLMLKSHLTGDWSIWVFVVNLVFPLPHQTVFQHVFSVNIVWILFTMYMGHNRIFMFIIACYYCNFRIIIWIHWLKSNRRPVDWLNYSDIQTIPYVFPTLIHLYHSFLMSIKMEIIDLIDIKMNFEPEEEYW